MSKNFSAKLLSWYDSHGRKHLPWQHAITPYRVWLSEIMLQQTQVDTVIPYFNRFIERYPELKDLAEAPLDNVLHLWTGLGYYARARNLHRCAQQILDDYGGHFPSQLEQLAALPGIGPSTAAAITSIAFQQPTAILDGNVKRVLARYHAMAGWPGQSAVAKQLWQYAHQHMPRQRCRDYTQAIMDLGATLCRRAKPDCPQCPLRRDCLAHKQGDPLDFPGKKPRKRLPIKTLQMLIIQTPGGDIFLEKRPANGIWGGLWSLPELDIARDAAEYVEQRHGTLSKYQDQALLRHTFSHYHLDIQPVLLVLKRTPRQVAEAGRTLWYNVKSPAKIGLAAPVKKLIAQSSAP